MRYDLFSCVSNGHGEFGEYLKWFTLEKLLAEMGRISYGPKWSWAEIVMDRNDPEPTIVFGFSNPTQAQWSSLINFDNDNYPQAESPEEEPVRDYELNCDSAMRKKAKACSVDYFVSGEEKGGNYVFSFSTAMYEIYRDMLMEYFQGVENSPNAGMNIKFKDISDKSGLTVESQIRVHQKTQNGSGRLKYTINLYHTNNRLMVNGRQATQFNAEHVRLTNRIMASGEVRQLDRDMLSQIEASLNSITVRKPKTTKSTTQSPKCNLNESKRLFNDSNTNEAGKGASNVIICPTCEGPLDALPSICCDKCETWFHFDCEQISVESRSILDNSDIGYICLGCKCLTDCEGLNESLDFEGRNIRESDPEPNDEETHRKVGYEPNWNEIPNIPHMQSNEGGGLVNNTQIQQSSGSVRSDPYVHSSPIHTTHSNNIIGIQAKGDNPGASRIAQSNLVGGQGEVMNSVRGQGEDVILSRRQGEDINLSRRQGADGNTVGGEAARININLHDKSLNTKASQKAPKKYESKNLKKQNMKSN